MKKKHYEAIAAAILKTRADYALEPTPPVYRKGACEALCLLAYRLARAMAADNPKFDRDRFLAACGVESNQH